MQTFARLAIVVLTGHNVLAADSLQELIAAVEQNESHYVNLRLDLTTAYQFFPPNVVAPQDGGDTFEPNLQTDEQISINILGDRLRTETLTTWRTRLLDGSSEVTMVFDGRINRHFWKHRIVERATGDERMSQSSGQISDDPPSLTNLARPHMFLLELGCPKVPLSTYLKGERAVRAFPNPDYFPEGATIKVDDLGSATFQNLKCRRILINTIFNGTPNDGWELWLAENRNFIPVRNLGYMYRSSKDTPVAESTVDEWMELRPGVWFPVKAHTDKYDDFALNNQGPKQLRWHKLYKVRNLSLEAETKPESFTELNFPPGTPLQIGPSPKSNR